MFENLELTCHLTSFHDEFIVAPSGWKPPDADATSVCRESTQILQDRETCSQSMQAPLTLKVKPLLISIIHIYVWYKYPLKRNCHIFRPIRCEEHVVWQPALSLCAIPFNGIPPLVSCIPRWGMPELRCSRNGSLDNDDTEKSLRLSTLHKWNQQIWHRSRTAIFLSFLLAVDRKSVRIYCVQRRLFTVSCQSVSRLKVITTHTWYVLYYYVLWSTCFVCIADENPSFISWSVMLFTRLVNAALTRYFA